MSAAHRKSSGRWIVRCVIVCFLCGAAWAWQSGWLFTAIPASMKLLSAIGQKHTTNDDSGETEQTTQVPVENDDPPAEHFASELGDGLDRRELDNPFARESRSASSVSRGTVPRRVIPVGFDETPNPSDGAESPPIVAAKERTSSSTGKAQPVASPKSSPAAIMDLGGKSTPLLDRTKIEQLIELGDLVTAQRELSRWYWQKPELRESLRPKLDEMALSLYFAPQPLFRDAYVVQAGDQLRVIAQRHKMSWEYLAKLNRTDPKKIREGQKLKVVDGPFGAVVFLSNYELIVHLQGSFVKSYRVGAGKVGTTPLGTFAVKNKLADPTYYGPDGLVIANNDPKNPLGERWIDIGDSYGIHGTIEPDTIGKNESRGCIRMLNAEVEEVYDFLVVGSEVRIIR